MTKNSERILLKLTNISKVYQGSNNNGNNRCHTLLKHVILDDLTLHIKEGDYSGAVGLRQEYPINIIASIDSLYDDEYWLIESH